MTINDNSGALGVADDASYSDWLLPELVKYAFTKLFLDPATEVAITFVDAAEMERLHLAWMNLAGPTDVMSFPMDQLVPGTAGQLTPPGVLGDIVVCFDVAKDQALAADHELQTEVRMLITHSLLHLVGYDHDTPVKEAEMFGLQRQLLAEFEQDITS
ncbi:rRNA maturation RNase YbeY [Canibacter sp. lx-45]|nr:rRNA maturation RNase YbeY [Canibacter zhuwentaonis]